MSDHGSAPLPDAGAGAHPESSAGRTVGAALELARQMNLPRLDTQWLLAHTLRRPRTWLLANDDAQLDAQAWNQFTANLERLAADVPLAHLIGAAEFHGLSLRVTSDVLVPRADTEVLVDWALSLLALGTGRAAPPRVVDLGTGTGAIALAVKQAQPDAPCCATDLSTEALAVAASNALALNLEVEFLAGSWWQPLRGRRFDLALSNPPYIAQGDNHLLALRHEPLMALASGPQGMDDLTEIARAARDHIECGGWLLLEHGHDQGQLVRELLSGLGYLQVQTRRDLAQLERCTGGQWVGDHPQPVDTVS
jgi:release factor glutamine methyltransferase